LRVLGSDRIHSFDQRHANYRKGVQAWVAMMSRASWQSSHELIAEMPKTRGLGQGRFIFKLCGNHVRALAIVNFRLKVIEIRFVGTHVDYDRVDAHTV
jgi:mRNA interferase HigB